jgi:hypothetical protein
MNPQQMPTFFTVDKPWQVRGRAPHPFNGARYAEGCRLKRVVESLKKATEDFL